MTDDPSIPIDLKEAVACLLKSADLRGEFRLSSLRGGSNNRVFRVDVMGSNALLKVYFSDGSDLRDRLGAEFSFSKFAWENGIRRLPRPLASNPQHHLGLYEFVSGRQLMPHEITEPLVCQAITFYEELNSFKHLPSAGAIPKASEACFTMTAHLRSVEQRLGTLKKHVRGLSETDREAAHFIRNELSEVWDVVSKLVKNQIHDLGPSLENELIPGDWCLSPSDFGFHNALLTEEGKLRFIDFEYAGWDDPAKMVCDFFCQPAVPVSLDFYDRFVEAITANLSKPDLHRQRIRILLPVYQVKWGCIILNDFLPAGSARRRFAGNANEAEERKTGQLKKARQALETLIR